MGFKINTPKRSLNKAFLKVKKHYHLTYEEVKIVDPEFEMSEQEYNDFKFD